MTISGKRFLGRGEKMSSDPEKEMYLVYEQFQQGSSAWQESHSNTIKEMLRHPKPRVLCMGVVD